MVRFMIFVFLFLDGYIVNGVEFWCVFELVFLFKIEIFYLIVVEDGNGFVLYV